MTGPQITPGPWLADDAGGTGVWGVFIEACGCPLAYCIEPQDAAPGYRILQTPEASEANAKAMAAVPAMIEALRKIVRRSTPHELDTPEDRKRDLHHVKAAAEEALRQAGVEL